MTRGISVGKRGAIKAGFGVMEATCEESLGYRQIVSNRGYGGRRLISTRNLQRSQWEYAGDMERCIEGQHQTAFDNWATRDGKARGF